jgi:succinate dehydrogenase/fumarate reductase flavoprotein subunit
MLIHPTLHYQNGGLDINSKCETNVPGLYASGEVSGGVHGENRLMGNSLLDVMVFGRIAGTNAADYIKEHGESGNANLDHVKRYNEDVEAAGIEGDRIAPMLLPDYSNPDVRGKQHTKDYFGTLS